VTQIPILAGVYGSSTADIRISYPVNLEPVLADSGISKGYLRSAPGIALLATGPGADRGAISWNGVCIRVMGDRLVTVSGNDVTDRGFVGVGGPVSLDYSFDRLAIASAGNLYYWDGTTLAQVTDPDLGTVIDALWIDGYFMTTDGTSLVVTELNDPTSVDPLKYGSSEGDPDPIKALAKVRGEVYALNRYTIENFLNVGGSGFPFSRNTGAMIPKGCVGTHAKTYFLETFAFVGSGRNEAVSVYLAGSGQALPMSTPEIDRQLAALSDVEQAAIEVEARVDQNEQRLLIHLPDRTLVYNHQASRENDSPVWHILATGAQADQAYVGRHFVLSGGRWICGSAAGQVGYLDNGVETQFGAVAGWRFDTVYLYNASKGGILRAVELVGLPGHAPLGPTPTCFLSITTDGETWGQERARSMGAMGERRKRVQWRPGRRFSNYCGLRFRGANTAIASWARLEADIEALNA
jgi:hypothetical protein